MDSNEAKKARTKVTKQTVTAPAPEAKKTEIPVKGIGPENAAYSETWMYKWLVLAANATNAFEVCQMCDPVVTMAQYREGRIFDRNFDVACLIFDQVVDLRIIESIRGVAAHGGTPSQGMYFKEVRLPAFKPPFASWNAPPPLPPAITPLAPEVADAMIKAGLDAYELLNRPETAGSKAEAPKSSRSRSKVSKSRVSKSKVSKAKVTESPSSERR